ncbi:hypothetical protein JOE21_002161 [Desmospora profundinema]|uniref:Uncharacterized protein n=1 Tax=Desmospora profundinema TaxID=1571184 RepID=A0ABU1IN00_9BACL|nr:hypothetical protein [Desmospora profundinema]
MGIAQAFGLEVADAHEVVVTRENSSEEEE